MFTLDSIEMFITYSIGVLVFFISLGLWSFKWRERQEEAAKAILDRTIELEKVSGKTERTVLEEQERWAQMKLQRLYDAGKTRAILEAYLDEVQRRLSNVTH
jgi:hypothetical protein